jgi:CRP-like cAMP-binding protein
MSPSSLRNRILAALPAEQRARIIESSDHILLKLKAILMDYDRPVDAVYFPLEGMVSMVSVLSDGSAVESATIGNEGMVGLPLFLGAESMSAQVFVQVSGTALRLSKDDFLEELETGPALRTALSRYTQGVMTLLSQTSACNRRHSMEERCARWLLLTHDRVSSDTFELTQRFLAMMLGVRRPSVTVAAGMLQKAGLIEYERGMLTVVDRAGLERASCECYAIVHNEFARLQGLPPVANPMAEVALSYNGQTTTDEVEPAYNHQS